MEKLLSVIIPVYNTEEYLAECLESVLAVDRLDYEVIVINDGSTDNSQRIIDEYVSRDSRIRAFAQPNGGLSKTRNNGISYSEGKYIMFVDSDDSVTESGLRDIFAVIEEYADKGVDVFRVEVSDTQKTEPQIYDYEQAVEYFLYSVVKNWPAVLYIVKKELIIRKQLSFKEGFLHEDVLWSTSLLLASKLAVGTGIPSYVQRNYRAGSITSTPNPKRLKDVCVLATQAQALVDDSSLSKKTKKKLNSRLTQTITTTLWLYYHMNESDKKEVARFFRNNRRAIRKGRTFKNRIFTAGCYVLGFSLTMKLLKPMLSR